MEARGASNDDEVNGMTLPKITFNWEVNLGAVLQMVTVLGAALTLYGIGVRFQYDTEAGIKRADVAREKYVPIIETLVKSDDVQNFRMETMATAIADQRRLLIDNTQKLADIATDLAVVKDRLPPRKSELNTGASQER